MPNHDDIQIVGDVPSDFQEVYAKHQQTASKLGSKKDHHISLEQALKNAITDIDKYTPSILKMHTRKDTKQNVSGCVAILTMSDYLKLWNVRYVDFLRRAVSYPNTDHLKLEVEEFMNCLLKVKALQEELKQKAESQIVG